MGHSQLALFPLLLLAISIPGCIGRHKHFHSRVPIVDLNGAEELIGTVREDEPLVTISPQLRILHGTGPICRYELSWADETGNTEPIPFEARVLDSAEGIAQIRHKTGSAQLDCAQKAEYRLRLEAVKCGDELAKSESVELRISVQDVNNHPPEFDAPWYSFDVDEGKAGPMEIARLLATDKDCGHPYGKVCRYELTNTLPTNPFHIDDRGVLSALRPLNRSQAESHILTVVAEDCGMLRSKSVLVTVNVRPRCVDSFKSISGQMPVHILQGDLPKFVLPDAEVHICGGEECTAEADLVLEKMDEEKAHLVGKEKLAECGMDGSGIELLNGEEMNGNGTKRKENMSGEDAEDDDDETEDEEEEEEEEEKQWMFDGKRNLEITKQKLVNVISERFSLLFSMKMEPGTEEQQRQKQNILCETDEHGLNRHHFAVYIRHCKLELLLRREPEEASAEFRAAEWRWNDERICDGQWHRYGLLFSDLDNVQLMIDGMAFNASQRNPEILDDWPLHQVKDKRTRLVVGACWHGRQRQTVQHFIGHLSSMWIWNDQVKGNEALHCAHGNHEKLQMANELPNHQQIVRLSDDQSSLHLHAQSTTELAHLLRSVQYVLDSTNSHLAPFVREGQRRIQVTGSLNCANNVSRPLAPISALVEVSRNQAHPQLSVTGRHIVLADRQSLKIGVALLPDVQITVTEGLSDATSTYKLDWCRVHLRPTRDMDLELFSSPTLLLEKLDLQFAHDKQGFALKGRESPQAYADVLAHIHYFNLRPESFPHRSYTLQCAMMGGKLLSNELFTTMNVDATPVSSNNELDEAVQKLVQISDKLDHDMLPSGMEANKEVDGPSAHHLELPSFDQLGANRLQNILEMDLPRPKALLGHHGYEVGQGAVAGGAVAVVVVICVGFLLVLLVIGVLKMRDQPLGPRRRRSRRDSMLEWDDNGMVNITINPLEEVGGKAMALDYSEGEEEDEEEEDDDDSGSEDGGEGEVEVSEDEAGDEQVLPLAEAGNCNGVGLEWDDSTLDGSSTGLSNQNNGKKGHRL